jgi:hypothetical protein
MAQVQRKPVKTLVDGVLYEGTQEVTGTVSLKLKVIYQGREKSDFHDYRPGDDAMMDGIAQKLLQEIIKSRGQGL